MNLNSFDFNWDFAKNFLIVAEHGSLSSASKILKISQPTLSRQISTLEEQLGVDLFERSTKGLLLTSTGQLLFQYVQQMAGSARKFSLAATSQSQDVRGKVKISVPEFGAAYFLYPVISELQQTIPEVEIELQVTKEVADLIERDADIAIRGFRPTQAELITKRVQQGNAHLYASHDYLASFGVEEIDISTLREATFINFVPSHPRIADSNPQFLEIKPERPPIISTSDIVGWEMVKKGLGIGFMMEEVGDACPMVRRVLPNMPPLTYELWIVVHKELRSTPRLKMVFDCIVKHFASI